MKDYSLTIKDRRDFVLGYDISKDGKIVVKFAEGEPIILPYNEINEKILLDKMEEQVALASKCEEKYMKKKENYVKLLRTMLGSSIISTILILLNNIVFLDTIFAFILSFSVIYGVVYSVYIVNINNMLDDLAKNKKFLELSDKINTNIKNNNNTLANVSSYTKKVVKDNVNSDRPLFDINSFNYVNFEDLEQISENIDRDRRFGFDYTMQETPGKSIVRKKTR